ncbi:venom metalloproteinase BumaMPs1-like isoform X1 [Rhipicephalus microplus]|uniref:venom metalloproteinase BumaMPs1-like isoform X1 n=1 Tax=Rhipicephalus microplus TaxID=6941 RepID=UPI003F6C5601
MNHQALLILTMRLNAVKWCVLVLAVVHESKAAETFYPRMLESRAEDGSKIVKISDDITLTLRKSSIFSEEFFIHSTRDGVPIAYHMRGSELEKNLYHDEEQMASVHLSEDDGITIEGVLGDTLRIKPEEGRERSADGQVAHTLFDVEYADGEGLNPNDYAVPNETKVMPESRLLFAKGLRIPVFIRPEVFVVVDFDICSAMKFNKHKISRYIAILGNSANLRYRSMVQPKVQLTIVGISMTQKRSDEPYMVEVSGYEATKNVLYGETVRNFMNFVAKQAYFATSDIIMLLTGRNMSRWNNNELIGNCGGFAYLAGACTQWRVGMTEERVGSYYGVFVFAHELAHSLGCVHDGQGADSWPEGHIGSADCPSKDSYMMSYEFKAPNMYKFSPCCQREVLNVYNRPRYECLIKKNSVTTSIHSSKFPGEVSSRTTYCRQVYSRYTFVTADKKYDMRKCIVRCFINKNGGNMLIGAVDGVHCDKKKICVLGNCTSKPEIDKAE